MNNKEFVEKLFQALESPTIYGTGAFGAPTGYSNNTERYYENTKKNIGQKYADRIKAAPAGTFIFDCIGLGKGIVWHWSANPQAKYGGAIYKADDIPDFSIKSLHKYCEWTESDCLDPNEIEPGEWLRTSDNKHVAYYVGDGTIIESTTRGEGKVVRSLLGTREWNGHGKLNYIEYIPESFTIIGEITCPHCGTKIDLFTK